MKRRYAGTVLIVLGFSFLCAAVLFFRNNLQIQDEAGQYAQQILQKLEIPETQGEKQPVQQPEKPQQVVQQQTTTEQLPLHMLDPQLPMPEKEVDGVRYVGMISIPVLELELPVISETSSANLQVAPCRYTGSVYLDNLVIGAHNYTTHFGRLKNLAYGDAIFFTDMDGNRFDYVVADMEVLKPQQVEYLCDGQWPLSLYTCTLGGRTRVTIRCEKVDE